MADTGPGMSSADRARIFEPFYSKKFLKRSGTGIALAMLRNIMEEHNGWVDLSAKNEPHRSNQGNRFDLYFPIKPVQMYSAKESSKEELSGQGRGRGQQQQILIIEKEKEQQERAIEFLTEIGYKALSVSNDTGAISYLNRNKVDLVIMDLVIMDLSEDEFAEGVAIYEQILFLHPSQKTVLICTNPECKSVKEIQQRGKVLLLQDPFTEEQLQRAVEEGLS
ncbi:MAG: response regulator [Candidatus Electrothrix sp. GM3_4]|nr:response regulator [Candidatus Electrothrix sp. GM3_4]